MSAKVIQYRKDMPQYFDQLPAEMQSITREFLEEFAEYEPGIEAIECRRRDGFIPHAWNRGGLEFTQGECNCTQHTIRVLYSGDGEFNVEVFHSISDAPYHRTCDGSKRWEFSAFNALQLKHELERIKSEVVDSYI